MNEKFNAWAFCRDLLNRGAVIERDSDAQGVGYERHSAKLDAAASQEAKKLERLIADRAALLAFARDIASNYDHEQDYHRNEVADTCCRRCKAEEVIRQAEKT